MKKPAVLLLVVSLLLVSCKQEVYYNVTTAVQPAEGGAIVVTPSSESVLDGTAITIQAIPNGDYSFTGWGGSLSGTENPTTIVVTTDLNLFANFSLRSYALTITTEGKDQLLRRSFQPRPIMTPEQLLNLRQYLLLIGFSITGRGTCRVTRIPFV